MPPLRIGGPYGIVYPQGDEPFGFFYADILERHVADKGAVGVIDPQRPFPAGVVDDVAVAENDSLHRIAELRSDAQGMRDLVPEDAFLGQDVLAAPSA